MARQRKTWKQAEQGKQASPPPQMPAVDRTEGPSHPAYYKDPDADQYEKGDTSAWAEDPHKPMEEESPPPAMPGNFTTEEPSHPALSDFQKKPESPAEAMAEGGGGGKKQASLKEMAEKRATLCVRIASAMMPGADAAAVENKALELMDYDDVKLHAAAEVLTAGEEEEMEEEDEEMEMEGGKKASHEITARLDRLEDSMGRLVQAMTHFFGMEGDEDEGMSDKELMAYLMAEDMDGDGVDQNAPDYGYSEDKKSGQDEFDRGEESEGTKEYDEEKDSMMHSKGMDEDGEEEAMLKAMLEEMDEEMRTASEAEEVTEPLAKGQTIQSGEGGNVNPDDYAPTPVVAQSDGSDKVGDPTPHGGKQATDTGAAENDIQLTAGEDPMGLVEKEASADDELMQLYADLDLPKSAADKDDDEHEGMEDEDEHEGMDHGKKKAKDHDEHEGEDQDEASDEDDDAKMSGKKAGEGVSLKPQQKAASQGAQRLGNVSQQTKVAADEMDQLSKLWDSAPDVSSVFGTTPTR